MASPSFLAFLGIQIVIGTLRSIAPASAVYLVFCATVDSQYFNPFLALYAISESLFYLLVYLPRSVTLQAPSEYLPPLLTQAQRRSVFAKCLESIEHDVMDLEYPACWFLPRHSRPNREDVVDWLLWSFFNTSRQQSDTHQRYADELREYIELIEDALGTKFEHGHSKDEAVRSMRVNLDRVDMLHRPLVWYFVVALVDIYTSITLLIMGFEHYTPRESKWHKTFPPRPLLHFFSRPAPEGAVFPYWHRLHKSSGTTKLPLLFLHGIGVGWFAYIPFLRVIVNEDPDVGILLPEFMSICMHMTPQPVPPLPLMLASLDLVLESLSTTSSEPTNFTPDPHFEPTNSSRPWSRVVLVAHSYGTFISGWIIRKMTNADSNGEITYQGLTDKITHVVLVDPIPILLSNAVVAHNFLYRSPSTVCPYRLGSKIDDDDDDFDSEAENGSIPRQPKKTSFYSSPAAWLLWYFASREADIARTLFRSFFWFEGAIWRDDIAAFMTGRTGLVSTDQARNNSHRSSREPLRRRRNMAVILEGLDQIVPAQGIRRYLTREKRPGSYWSGRARIVRDQGQVEILSTSAAADDDDSHEPGGTLEVLYHPQLDHSGIFEDPKWMGSLLDVVQRYIHDE